MTIQEAMKSGRRFKRPEWENWTWVAPRLKDSWDLSNSTTLFADESYPQVHLTPESVLANDYELAPVTVTLESFTKAYLKCLAHGSLRLEDTIGGCTLAKELGLLP